MITVNLDDLIEINQGICEDDHKQSIVLNKDNLLSALSVQQWYEEDCMCASALIRSLTIAHGFQDGNKRTAAVVGTMILDYECTEDAMIDCILDIAKGQLKDVDVIARMLYPNSCID